MCHYCISLSHSATTTKKVCLLMNNPQLHSHSPHLFQNLFSIMLVAGSSVYVCIHGSFVAFPFLTLHSSLFHLSFDAKASSLLPSIPISVSFCTFNNTLTPINQIIYDTVGHHHLLLLYPLSTETSIEKTMLRLNCNSTPSPSPFSSQGGSGQIFNDEHGVLNVSPRPSSSYNLSPVGELGKLLHDQTSVWSESEMEMTPRSFSSFASDATPNAKSSVELVKEITSIEIEILHLERYLLSLYRTAFEQHIHTHNTEETNGMPSRCKIESHLLPQSCEKVKADARLSGYHCGQEGNDQIGSSIAKSSSGRETSAKRHHRSLGDHLGTPCTHGARPDRLSEDIVRCISSIYCKLGDPNQCHQGPSDSSVSSLSSSTTISTTNLSDTWSPSCNEERGPYAEMIEILKIGLDDDGFNYATKMLKHFRTLIKKLENIDPRKMEREQKLAFWINLHNALVMHAHLAYGTHNNSRTNSILKATYNVGGHCINAYIIQSSILGIRSHFRASWLQSLLSPGRKLTTVPNKHVYAIEYPEPLVHFALSLGAFSDPAVRIYKAKSVFQDLRVAKEEFIRSTVNIHKESKIYVPKILYYFAKDMSLTVPGLLEMVNACLPESQQKAIKRNVKGKHDKYVCWLSQSCIFRYVILRDAIEIEGRLSV